MRARDRLTEFGEYVADFCEDLGLAKPPEVNSGEDRDRPRGRVQLLLFAALPAGVVAAAIAFVGFFVWLGAWLNDHWGIYAVLPQAGFMLLAVWGLAREQRRKWEERRAQGLRMELPKIDALHHREFEIAVRNLMRRDGITAERVGGAGDDACDVYGLDADGRVWAVQCKHRRDGWAGKATGVDVLQQVKGTAKPVHGAQFAVVVTNGRFTKPAVDWGEQHGIRLIDRHQLQQWADKRQPLWEVLGDVRRPKRLPGRPARRRRAAVRRAAARLSANGSRAHGRPTRLRAASRR